MFFINLKDVKENVREILEPEHEISDRCLRGSLPAFTERNPGCKKHVWKKERQKRRRLARTRADSSPESLYDMLMSLRNIHINKSLRAP